MAPSSLCRLGEQRQSNSTKWVQRMKAIRGYLFLSSWLPLVCSVVRCEKNNLLFLKSLPDFSLSGRWIVLLIGTEMPNILMSPCIHFVSRAHFSWAVALFTFSPTGHFQLIPGLTVIGSHTQTVKKKKIHYLFAFLSHCPLAAFLSPASCQ